MRAAIHPPNRLFAKGASEGRLRPSRCARLPKYEEVQLAHVAGAFQFRTKHVRHDTASAQPLHTKNRPSAKQAEYLRGTQSTRLGAAVDR